MPQRRSSAPRKRTPPKPATTSRRARTEVAAVPKEADTTFLEPMSSSPPPDANGEAVPDQNGHDVSHTHPLPRVMDVFLIDSGWNTPVSAAVKDNLPAVAAYLKAHRFYVLDREQSTEMIHGHPALVGADPILLVIDRKAAEQKTGNFGFRLCLGNVHQPEAAVSLLKWAVQLTMTASAAEMTKIIRTSAHRESFQGMVELIGTTHLMEFAPL